jgi:hypothetical protein
MVLFTHDFVSTCHVIGQSHLGKTFGFSSKNKNKIVSILVPHKKRTRNLVLNLVLQKTNSSLGLDN